MCVGNKSDVFCFVCSNPICTLYVVLSAIGSDAQRHPYHQKVDMSISPEAIENSTKQFVAHHLRKLPQIPPHVHVNLLIHNEMDTSADRNRTFVTELTFMHLMCGCAQLMGGLSFWYFYGTPNGFEPRFPKKHNWRVHISILVFFLFFKGNLDSGIFQASPRPRK